MGAANGPVDWVVFGASLLPFHAMGLVRGDESSLLQRACVTFSELRKVSPVPPVTAVPSGVPIWHVYNV